MALLVLVRHGQSQYNLENRFTGWLDVPLTPEGHAQAKKVGEKIKNKAIVPDVIFTSALSRAHQTLEDILHVMGLKNIPIHKHQALNERHYGDLQGKNKKETAQEFGEDQVHIWRRSFDVPPPNGESLKDTAARTIPYFKKEILPFIEKNKNVLVVAHGNSLRSIVMDIESLTPEQILKRELETGEALVYSWDAEKKKFILQK